MNNAYKKNVSALMPQADLADLTKKLEAKAEERHKVTDMKKIVFSTISSS